MVEFFGRTFTQLGSFYQQHLQTLENQGCVYEYLPNDSTGQHEYARIRFEPDEIVKYVDALKAFDEFQKHVDRGLSPEDALDNISNGKIKRRVKEYNEWVREDQGADNQAYCPAAFMGEIEDLLIGLKPERYEFHQAKYTSDRRFLLDEIIEGFHESSNILQDRDGGRPDFEITCEQDVQDLFYALVKPIFPDARPEEYTPKHSTSAKRIDFVIPSISTVIEIKYARSSEHARKVPDELKIDIESYHKHTECSRLIAVVWDGDSHITDRSNFEDDLTGQRTIDGQKFQVEVNIVP